MSPERLSVYSIHDTQYEVKNGINLRAAGELRTRAYAAGERIKFDRKTAPEEIVGLCKVGIILPVDIPALAKYKARVSFSFRVIGRGVEQIKPGEVVEMLAEDAWKYLIEEKIEPLDRYQWAPGRLCPPRQKAPHNQVK